MTGYVIAALMFLSLLIAAAISAVESLDDAAVERKIAKRQ